MPDRAEMSRSKGISTENVYKNKDDDDLSEFVLYSVLLFFFVRNDMMYPLSSIVDKVIKKW